MYFFSQALLVLFFLSAQQIVTYYHGHQIAGKYAKMLTAYNRLEQNS
jgi:hypothetical protein